MGARCICANKNYKKELKMANYEVSKSDCGCYYYVYNTVTMEQECDYLGTPIHFKTYTDALDYATELNEGD